MSKVSIMLIKKNETLKYDIDEEDAPYETVKDEVLSYLSACAMAKVDVDVYDMHYDLGRPLDKIKKSINELNKELKK